MAHTNYRRKIKKQYIYIWGALPLGASKEEQRFFWKRVRRTERDAVARGSLDDLPKRYPQTIKYNWW